MQYPRELCDQGPLNGQPGSTCSVTCRYTYIPNCGNGIVDAGEECDDGNNRDGDSCTSLCKRAVGYCGDGVVQSALGEQCDDGNRINNDDCDNFCKWTPLPECGDGILQPEFELCDAGVNRNSNAGNAECRPNCVPQRCGDAILDNYTEQCDDGNNLNNDGCSAVCTRESPAAPPPTATIIPPPPRTTYVPPTIPTPARTPTGPGLVIFLASGAAAGVGIVRKRFVK